MPLPPAPPLSIPPVLHGDPNRIVELREGEDVFSVDLYNWLSSQIAALKAGTLDAKHCQQLCLLRDQFVVFRWPTTAQLEAARGNQRMAHAAMVAVAAASAPTAAAVESEQRWQTICAAYKDRGCNGTRVPTGHPS